MSEAVADVLIVGAGASGAAAAWSLSDTGMRIVCLEQGGWVDPRDYPTNAANWESQSFGPYAIDPNVRGLETEPTLTRLVTDIVALDAFRTRGAMEAR